MFNGCAAEQAGLAPGDIIIAIDELVVSAADIPGLLERHAGSESLLLHYSRHGVLRQAQLPLITAEVDTCSLSSMQDHPQLWPVVAS